MTLKQFGMTAVALAMTIVYCHGSDGTLVFSGHLEFVQRKSEAEFERERGFGLHENLQFIVVDVERDLVGSGARRMLVGIRVDRRDAMGVDWLSPSYGVLNRRRWRMGSRVVVVVSRGLSDSVCSPPLYEFKEERPNLADPNRGGISVSIDRELRLFQKLTTVCVSIGDVFIVRD